MSGRIWALSVLALSSVGCSSESAPEPPGTSVQGAGVADAGWLVGRKLDYLRFETNEVHLASPVNLIAHMTRRRLEPSYAPSAVAAANAWDGAIGALDALDDGRDFLGLYILYAYLGFGDDPMLSPELRARAQDALLRFKFWFTQETPPGKVDNSYYWSENHQAIYRTIEYLVGQRFPDRAMGTDGKPGRDHAASAKKEIERWLELRLRFGFAEWHSNVYYQKDVTPLLTLVEFAGDEDIRARASMVLDLLFFDFALHTQKDAFGVTHGRSYKKDKMKSDDEDTWSLTKLLFGQSRYDYSRDDAGAAFFAASTRYAFPEILRRAGVDRDPMVDRERMGIPMDENGPVDADVAAPFGFSYTDPEDLPIWWGMGALTAWPVVPITLQTMDQYGLWDSGPFAQLSQFKPLGASPRTAQSLSVSFGKMINFGLMKEVDTYTYRDADTMLSSAIDYRKGTFNQQTHSWQATLDARAIVFTNHPFRPLALTGDWLDDPESGGYWNGEASAPRSGQVQNVAIHIYAPQYPRANDPPFDYFHYEPYTHAYFPQDYFDEVVQRGPWTFGRLGKGYVALYSYRPAQFLVYDGKTQATGGRVKPFDLRADGGADNVFIVEVGREAAAGSFAAFQDAVAAAKVVVTSRGPGKPTGESDGFDVAYASPSQGPITFGWEAPLTARGVEVPLRGPGRYDNPYAHVPSDPTEIVIDKDGYGLRLELARGRRFLYGP
jgi:hypothetical protein